MADLYPNVDHVLVGNGNSVNFGNGADKERVRKTQGINNGDVIVALEEKGKNRGDYGWRLGSGLSLASLDG